MAHTTPQASYPEASAPDEGLPLHGVNVLELAHFIAGPHASSILLDHGADVIKVEPPRGEPGRRTPPLTADGESLYFATYNRGKKSIALDLRDNADRPVLDELIRWADIIVTNQSLDVPARLGYDYERACAINPAVIMVQITGFGASSAMADYLAFDSIAQAMTGLASLTGEPDGQPTISSVFISDHVTGIQAAFAAVLALQQRTQTGQGTYVEVTMQRATTGLLGSFIPQAGQPGPSPVRAGNRAPTRFANVYPTRDSSIVVSPNTIEMWKSLCEEIGRPEWADPAITDASRHIFDEDLRTQADQAITHWLAQLSGDEAMKRLQSRGVPCGKVRTVSEVCRDEPALNLGLFSQAQLLNGTVVDVPGRSFATTTGAPERSTRVPALGADRQNVLDAIAAVTPSR